MLTGNKALTSDSYFQALATLWKQKQGKTAFPTKKEKDKNQQRYFPLNL